MISSLTDQQKYWATYIAAECDLIGTLSGAGGSWPSVYSNRCELNSNEERLKRINSAIKCVQKIPLENRWMDQTTCLQQLVPLANKL